MSKAQINRGGVAIMAKGKKCSERGEVAYADKEEMQPKAPR